MTKQLRDVAAMSPLWPFRLRDSHSGIFTFEQRDAAVRAEAPECSPSLQSAAISTRDLRHQTPPSAAVAHARPAGMARYTTRRRALCSHRSLLVIGDTILEPYRSEVDPAISKQLVRPATIKWGARGLAAGERFTSGPPRSSNGGKQSQGPLRGFRRLTSSAFPAFAVSQST
jgi:hypothetical protein